MKSIVLAMLIALSVNGVSPCNAAVKPCEVYSIFGSEITLEDSKGNLWAVEGCCEGLKENDNCLVLFDGKGTESIYDDEIIEVYVLQEGKENEVQC